MTSPFERPPSPPASAWIVHAVGSAVEIVHIGPRSSDLEAAAGRMITALVKAGHAKAMILVDDDIRLDRPIGIRVEACDGNADAIWRVLVTGFSDDTKIDNARILLGINRIAYVAIARRMGLH